MRPVSGAMATTIAVALAVGVAGGCAATAYKGTEAGTSGEPSALDYIVADARAAMEIDVSIFADARLKTLLAKLPLEELSVGGLSLGDLAGLPGTTTVVFTYAPSGVATIGNARLAPLFSKYRGEFDVRTEGGVAILAKPSEAGRAIAAAKGGRRGSVATSLAAIPKSQLRIAAAGGEWILALAGKTKLPGEFLAAVKSIELVTCRVAVAEKASFEITVKADPATLNRLAETVKGIRGLAGMALMLDSSPQAKVVGGLLQSLVVKVAGDTLRMSASTHLPQ